MRKAKKALVVVDGGDILERRFQIRDKRSNEENFYRFLSESVEKKPRQEPQNSNFLASINLVGEMPCLPEHLKWEKTSHWRFIKQNYMKHRSKNNGSLSLTKKTNQNCQIDKGKSEKLGKIIGKRPLSCSETKKEPRSSNGKTQMSSSPVKQTVRLPLRNIKKQPKSPLKKPIWEIEADLYNSFKWREDPTRIKGNQTTSVLLEEENTRKKEMLEKSQIILHDHSFRWSSIRKKLIKPDQNPNEIQKFSYKPKKVPKNWRKVSFSESFSNLD